MFFHVYGRILPASRYSAYQSSRLSSTSDACAISLIRPTFIVPAITWIFAGWRKIQAEAKPVGVV